MMIGALHHVTLTVRDIEASVRFYRDLLGLRVAMDMPMGNSLQKLLALDPGIGENARAVLMTQGDHLIGQVELIQFSPPGAATKPKRPGDPGVFQLCFEIRGEDLSALCDRLRSQGATFFAEAPVDFELKGYGHARAILLEDPDGVMVELIQLPTAEERKAYRTRGENR